MKRYFLPIFLLASGLLLAQVPVALPPYTCYGRLAAADHSAFGTNAVATLRAYAADGRLLAETRTTSAAYERTNYRLSVPLTDTPLEGYAQVGNLVTLKVEDPAGKVWVGVVADLTVGAPGSARQMDIVLSQDANGDGIDDELYASLLAQWEASDFWEAGVTFDPTRDYDGDGVSTLAEAYAGTDPFNKEDVLKIHSFTIAPTAETFGSLTFPPVAGRAYSIECADAIGPDAVWQRVDFLPSPEDTTPVSYLNAGDRSDGRPVQVYLLPTDAAKSFYRIHLE